MKTNSILILAVGFILLMMTSCRQEHLGILMDNGCEGEDVHLGDLNFDETTNTLVPDPATTESLIFVNGASGKIILNSEIQIEDDYQLKIEEICGNKDDIFADNVYSFYNAISARENYTDNVEYNLSFSRSTRVVEALLPEEEFLYDDIYVSGRFKETYFGTIHMITSVRGNEETFPQDFFIETNSYDFDETIELDGINYENVYSSPKTHDYVNGTIYMTKEAGVIGLLDKDEVFWKLQ